MNRAAIPPAKTHSRSWDHARIGARILRLGVACALLLPALIVITGLTGARDAGGGAPDAVAAGAGRSFVAAALAIAAYRYLHAPFHGGLRALCRASWILLAAAAAAFLALTAVLVLDSREYELVHLLWFRLEATPLRHLALGAEIATVAGLIGLAACAREVPLEDESEVLRRGGRADLYYFGACAAAALAVLPLLSWQEHPLVVAALPLAALAGTALTAFRIFPRPTVRPNQDALPPSVALPDGPWGRVESGVVLYLGGVKLFLVVGVLSPFAFSALLPFAQISPVIAIFLQGVAGAAPLALMLRGVQRCGRLPLETGATSLVTSAYTLLIIALAAFTLATVLRLGEADGPFLFLAPILLGLAGVTNIASIVALIVAFGRLGAWLGDPSGPTRARQTLILFGLALGLLVGAIALPFTFLLLIGYAILWLAALLVYIGLVERTADLLKAAVLARDARA